MKKAAKEKVVRSSKVGSKNSLLLVAVLILAVLAFVVWAVIAKSPGKTPHAQVAPAMPSLTVNWSTPAGNASFSDVNNKKANCQSATSTCSTGQYVYWPGSKVDYTVRVNSVSGPVLQKGSTTATTDGRAVANWSWKYEVNVFPDSLGSCTTAADKCVKAQAVTGNTYVANNLQYATIYRMIVCAPACSGGVIIQNTTAQTPPPPFTPLPTSSPNVSACVFSPTSITLGSSLGIIPNNFPAQPLNVELVGKSFANIVNLGTIPSTGGGVVIPTSVPAPQQYEVRVGNGFVSYTTCAGILTVNPVNTYNTCDFNKDRKVDQLDVNMAASGFGKVTTSLNQPYDVNKDGYVNSLDLQIISQNNPKYCN